MIEAIFYDPADPRTLPHNPIKAIVAPRPIGWISTMNAEGVGNLSPFSFFNLLCQEPWIVAFACETLNDTLANCQATGEFVHNLVPRSLAEAMNGSSANYPRGIDEMAALEIAAARCVKVAPRRVAESPAALECQVTEIRRLATLDGGVGSSHVVFGQIVGVHIRPDCLEDGIFRTEVAMPVARAGHDDYFLTDGPFTMGRPIDAGA